jgi:histidinol-phosphatase (PHP family)
MIPMTTVKQPITGNYHTHTRLCRHAEGMPDDYAAAALQHGLQFLGITDHTPLPDDRWLGVRMCMAQLDEYVQSIKRAQETYPQLTIFAALECEYVPEFHSFYEEVLLGEYAFDYLVYAPHWFLHQGEWLGIVGQSDTPERLVSYGKHAIRGLETGLFTFLAHPDIFGNDYLQWDASAQSCARDILAAAEALDIPLEINGLGFRREKVETPDGTRNMYPWRPFWQTAQDYCISVTTNSDAHRPQDIIANIDDARSLARELDLNIIELNTRLSPPPGVCP